MSNAARQPETRAIAAIRAAFFQRVFQCATHSPRLIFFQPIAHISVSARLEST